MSRWIGARGGEREAIDREGVGPALVALGERVKEFLSRPAHLRTREERMQIERALKGRGDEVSSEGMPPEAAQPRSLQPPTRGEYQQLATKSRLKGREMNTLTSAAMSSRDDPSPNSRGLSHRASNFYLGGSVKPYKIPNWVSAGHPICCPSQRGGVQ